MAFQQLINLLYPELTGPNRAAVARWFDTDSLELGSSVPDYGSFIDEDGMVVPGLQAPRVTLGSDDPRHLVLGEGVGAGWPENTTVVFLDWGRQTLSWEEIFDLWDAWDSQGMVVDVGAVSVPWQLADRWTAPGWIAFRDGFNGEPLSTVTREIPPTVAEAGAVATPAARTSFLAMAKAIRGETEATGELPMLPFTLASLQDPGHIWPQGAA